MGREKKKSGNACSEKIEKNKKKTMLEKKWTVLAWAVNVAFFFFFTNCEAVQRSGKKKRKKKTPANFHFTCLR